MSLLSQIQDQQSLIRTFTSQECAKSEPMGWSPSKMIWPWKVAINNFEYQFRTVTCIDAIIDLPEVIPFDNTNSKIVANAFGDNWLSQQSRPRKCIHDNSKEHL